METWRFFMRYHVKERAWSLTGDFDVRDEGGNPVFEVRGKFLSIGDNLTLFDRSSGQKLVHIKQRVLSLLPKYNLYNGNEEHWGSVSQRFALFGERFRVIGNNGAALSIKGDVWNWRFSIRDESGNQLGEVSRQFSLFRDSYAVDVAPGVDASFIVALVVILERVKEKRRRAAEAGALSH
jgi:uncharacterized protein YxjI